jgi:hypothetical protein
MFSWIRRRAPAPTVIGQNPDLLLLTAAWTAAEVIKDQLEVFTKETRRVYAGDKAARSGLDEFVVGYALGVALQTIKTNGGQGGASPELIAELQSRLETHLPDIQINKAVRANGTRFKCGLFLGTVEGERSGQNIALGNALQLTSHYQMAPALYFQQSADRYLQLSSEELDLLGRAGQLIAVHSGNPNAGK